MQRDDQLTPVLQGALYRVLKSLAQLAIRYGLSAGAVTELLRRAFVDAAEETLITEGKKPLSSRICTLTGLYRKEVVRIKELPPVDSHDVDDRYNRCSRVISGWVRDKEFCTPAGKPDELAVDGDNRSFSTLVRRYSGDMTPRSVLEELTRLKIVELTSAGSVRLQSRGFVPTDDHIATLQILGADTPELIDTIGFNIDKPADQRRFQRKVMYLHIPQREVQPFQAFASTESQMLLEKLDRWLDERDTEKQSAGTPGSRLGLGIYQFSVRNDQSSESDDAK